MRMASSSLPILAFLAACNNDYDMVIEDPNVNPGDVTACPFTPISGTKMSSYDCNPVFSTGETWGPSIDSVGFLATDIVGHPFYQMWYTGTDGGSVGGDWGLGYALSAEGTAWESHPENPLQSGISGTWDQDAMSAIQMVWDPSADRYVMAYQGFNIDRGSWGMGIATSPDGVDWTRLSSNPVIDFTDIWAEQQVCWPLTVRVLEGGALTGFVAAHADGYTDVCEVFATTAGSLDNWSVASRPALYSGPEYYDESGVTSASVVEYNGTLYMFYIGFERWISHTGYQSSDGHHLALAKSTDGGMTWIKDANNPLPINNSEDLVVNTVTAQVVGTRIHLWITDDYPEAGGIAVGYFLYEPDIEPHP